MSGQNIATGELKRTFKRLTLVSLVSGAATSDVPTQRTFVNNLSSNLKLIAQVGFIQAGDGNAQPTYPATPGTLQITPITKGDGNDVDLFGQPIFSAPFFTAALTIPTGWEVSTTAQKCAIDFAMPTNLWPVATNGSIVLDITVEYIGAWWDATAVAALLNKVVIEPAFTTKITQGGGS